MQEQLANLLGSWESRLEELDYSLQYEQDPSWRLPVEARRNTLNRCIQELKAILTHQPLPKWGITMEEPETIKVCGKYCGECVHAQWGSGDEKDYHTFCQALATMVKNTDNPLDQCPSCVIEEE